MSSPLVQLVREITLQAQATQDQIRDTMDEMYPDRRPAYTREPPDWLTPVLDPACMDGRARSHRAWSDRVEAFLDFEIEGHVELAAFLRCAARRQHRWGYVWNGPPVQDWGGRWYRCVACGYLGRARFGPVVVDREDHAKRSWG